MLRTDTGNYNRFLSSLGLLLLAAALLIPYFYFRDTDSLRVTRAELAELTPTGKDAIRSRQGRIQNLEPAVLVLAGLLAAGGAYALYLGGRRLRVAQGKEDEAIDRRAKKEDIEIEEMTPEEVDEKQDEQAREATQGESFEVQLDDTVRLAEQAEVEARPDPQPPAEPQRLVTPRPSLAENKAAIARIEEMIAATLGTEQSFGMVSDVKIGNEQDPGRPLQLDGLILRSGRGQPDIVVEVKLSPRRGPFQYRFLADQLIALVIRYRHLTGADAIGWLVLVTPSERESLPAEDREELKERLEASLLDLGKVSVLEEAELKQLPDLAKKLFS